MLQFHGSQTTVPELKAAEEDVPAVIPVFDTVRKSLADLRKSPEGHLKEGKGHVQKI